MRLDTHTLCGWYHPMACGPKQNKEEKEANPSTAHIPLFLTVCAMWLLPNSTVSLESATKIINPKRLVLGTMSQEWHNTDTVQRHLQSLGTWDFTHMRERFKFKSNNTIQWSSEMPGTSCKAHVYSSHWVMLLVVNTSTESGETSHPSTSHCMCVFRVVLFTVAQS